MSETKNETFECANELADQIHEKRIEFDGKYAVNESNMEKFCKVYDVFYDIADDNGGEVLHIDIHPETIHANVSIEVPLLDLHRDLMKRFVDILEYVDLLEITPTASDSIIIGVNVKEVWEAV